MPMWGFLGFYFFLVFILLDVLWASWVYGLLSFILENSWPFLFQIFPLFTLLLCVCVCVFQLYTYYIFFNCPTIHGCSRVCLFFSHISFSAFHFGKFQLIYLEIHWFFPCLMMSPSNSLFISVTVFFFLVYPFDSFLEFLSTYISHLLLNVLYIFH